MDSFASKDIQYPDGQPNKVVVPAEIQESGFKPPVRASNGELILGDALSANHLNYILNDIYNKLSKSRVLVDFGGDNSAGYRRYTNGDVEMWGGGVAGADGNTQITYPIALPAATRDIQVSILTVKGAADMSIHAVMVVDESQTATGFIARSIYRDAAANSTNVPSRNGFRWNANYRAKLSVQNG